MLRKSFLLLLTLCLNIYSQNFWIKTSFPSGTQLNNVYALLGLPDNTILAGTYFYGIISSTNNGNDWQNRSFDSMWVMKITIDNNWNLYALVVGGVDGSQSGLYKSTDQGINWNRIWIKKGGFNCIYIDENNNLYIGMNYYDGQGGIYKFNGSDWVNIFPYPAYVYSILKTSSGKILAAAYENGQAKIYSSIDEGTNWNSYSFGINFTSTDLIKDRRNNIYLSTAGYGIYLSNDDGNSFSQIGITGPEFTSLYIDGDLLYAGSNGYGVYRTSNLGQNWELLNDGFGQEKYVLSLGATPNGYLYAGMNYYGIYRSVNQVLDVESEITQLRAFQLYQNYPNPFNPKTRIKFSLADKNIVTLKLYDLLGREITTLLNEEKSPGIYEAELDLSNYNLAGGVYFIHLSSADNYSIKKMIYLK